MVEEQPKTVTSGSGGRVLGTITELGQYVFKVNTGNQAEAYIKAIEHIGEYVGLHYSKELQTLVEDQEEATFTEPKAPRKETEAAYGALEKYKAELLTYHKEKREYKDNKAKVFVIIFGQCTDDVKACLLDDSEFTTCWRLPSMDAKAKDRNN